MAKQDKLLIVESPAKAKTISNYLDNEYRVLASVGHIRDLPKSNKNAIDIEGGFIPHYEIVKGKEAIVAELRSAAEQAKEIFLATDPDREGEAIAWHILESLKLKAKEAKRIVFHEITKSAVREALEHPRRVNDNLRRAQEARRVLDRLFGYDLSALIWRKLRYGLSAGRVQSPALRILVEREKEIQNFVPESYWVLTADLETTKGETVAFTCTEEPKTEADAEQIAAAGRGGKWRVVGVKKDEAKRTPRPPFTTSTLQQAASSRLGLAPSQTMRYAQKLYEAGLITYMRTDSTNLSAGAVNEIGKLIKEKYGEKYTAGPRLYKTRSKSAQEAHEAIRPSDVKRLLGGAGATEKKLYQLIWRRTVASQMTDARLIKTKVIANIADRPIPDFTTSGAIITWNGWLAADPAARGEETELPNLSADDPLTLKKLESIAKETTPPNRYSEAGLVKELEKRGIGRPSTYAPIIKTLLDREYVRKINRSLQATETGEIVSDFLDRHFHDYISDSFTAKMENELDAIAAGEEGYEKTLKDFYGPFQKAIAGKKNLEKISNLGPAPLEFLCPKCDSQMIWKLSRSGKFMSCNRFPDCTGARLENGEEMPGPKEIGETCPDCGGQLLERHGRFGLFIACSNYPKCRFVKNDPEDEKNRDTGVSCPKCKAGTMVEKRGRYGLFYGCSNYPKCKNIVKSKPTGKLCPDCGALMMEGTKTIPERCSDKTCPNHRPDKLAGKN